MFAVNPELSTAAAAGWRASGGVVLTGTESAFAGDAMICGLRRCENRVTGPQTTRTSRFRRVTQRDGRSTQAWKPRYYSLLSWRRVMPTGLPCLGDKSPD